MTKIGFELKSIPPYRDVKGRFIKADAELVEGKRSLMRSGGRRFVELAQDEAPKRQGGFARRIKFKTYVESVTEVGFRVYMPQPLGGWIVHGTPAHAIPGMGGSGKTLKFLWEKGPRSSSAFTSFHFYKSVWHPGTKANPFMSRAFKRWIPGARKGLAQISRNYVRTIAGAAKQTTTF